MDCTSNQLKKIVNSAVPLPTSVDFVVEKKKRLANDIFNSLDKAWVAKENITFRQIITLVTARQDAQRYSREVLRAMKFLDDCEQARIPQEPSERRLQEYYIKNRWVVKEDFKKVGSFNTYNLKTFWMKKNKKDFETFWIFEYS